MSRFVSTRNVSVSSLASCVFLRTSRASAFFNASSARVSRSRVSSSVFLFELGMSSPTGLPARPCSARSRARRGGRSTKKPLVFPGVSLLTPTQRARTRTRRVAPRRRRATRRRFLFFSPTGRSRRSLSHRRFRLSSSRSRLASSRSRASVSTFSDIASSAALASSAAAAGRPPRNAENGSSRRRRRRLFSQRLGLLFRLSSPPPRQTARRSATPPRGSARRGGSRSGSGRAVPLVRRDGPDATGASVSGSGTSRGGSPRATDASSMADDEGWISDAFVVSEGSSSRIEASYEGGGCSGGGRGGLSFPAMTSPRPHRNVPTGVRHRALTEGAHSALQARGEVSNPPRFVLMKPKARRLEPSRRLQSYLYFYYPESTRRSPRATRAAGRDRPKLAFGRDDQPRDARRRARARSARARLAIERRRRPQRTRHRRRRPSRAASRPPRSTRRAAHRADGRRPESRGGFRRALHRGRGRGGRGRVHVAR